MDINIGDKVRFLNDVGGGVVSGFQKGGIVLVQDEDGFEMPVLAAEVVVVEAPSNLPRREEPRAAQEYMPAMARSIAVEKPRKEKKEKPEEPTEEDIRIAELKEYYRKKEERRESQRSAAEGESKAKNEKSHSDAGKAEGLEARIIRLEMTIRKLQMRIERLEDARALREKNKANGLARREAQRSNSDGIVEVDLHAHELLETTAGMDARDIKEYQLQTVRDTIKRYQTDKGRRIVFIHGNGEGVLRKALLDLFRREFPSCPTQDASFQQYGFGATMVTVR